MEQESSQIKLLRARYRLSMTDKSAELRELVEATSFKQLLTDNDQQLIDIREYLHKLAGSSGMYGYPDIAQLARAMMEHVEQTEVSVRSIQEKIPALSDLLEHHARG